MVIKIKPGDIPTAGEWMQNWEHLYQDDMITKIDQLIDRDVVRSKDKVSPFVEAYTSATGRKNSVTAQGFNLITNKYIAGKNQTNLSEGISNTTITGTNSFNMSMTSKNLSGGLLAVDRMGFRQEGSGSGNITITIKDAGSNIIATKLHPLPGSSGNNFIVTLSALDYTSFIPESSNFSIEISSPANLGASTGKTYDGTYVSFTSQTVNSSPGAAQPNIRFVVLENKDVELTHTIPAGTFKDTISSGVAAVKIVDWEDGASLQWKAQDYSPTGTDVTQTYISSYSLQSDSSNRGALISVNEKCILTSVTRYNGCTAPTAYVYRNTSLVASATFVGDVATFTPAVELNTNDSILCGGGTYTLAANTSVTDYPFTNTHVNFIGDSNFTGGTSGNTTRGYNITSIETQAFSIKEDTGWLDFNIDGVTAYAKISEFTAFTSEPTEFIVKLIPKSSSPQVGFPSISGTGIKLI